MREISRATILPLLQESTHGFSEELNVRLDNVSSCLPRLVRLGRYIGSLVPRIQTFQDILQQELPEQEATRRVAKNYAILMAVTELVSISNVTAVTIWNTTAGGLVLYIVT